MMTMLFSSEKTCGVGWGKATSTVCGSTALKVAPFSWPAPCSLFSGSWA